MVTNFRSFFPLFFVFGWASSAPTSSPNGKTELDQTRQQKSLPYFEYYQPDEIDYNNFDPETDDYVSMDVEENELSRTIPSSRKRYNNNRPPSPPAQQFNSPIYYIRLPPQPYMFIPGLGYVSQPSPHHMGQFLNVPVSFIANGKPSTIYQWSGGLGQFPGNVAAPPPPPPMPILPPKPRPTPPPSKPAESTVHRLPGQFTFNGKPEDIYVLRDSYNSLYSDALQNFYP